MNTFQKMAVKVPADNRCVQSTDKKWKFRSGHLYFGVSENDRMGWTTTDNVQSEIKGVSFYMGGKNNTPLVSSFIDSGYAEKVESLSIGTIRGMDYDNDAAVSKLKGVAFPELRVLELGVCELVYGSDSMHGEIGDVTDILLRCPKLETLGLYGNFTLNKSASFKHLKNLTVEPADSATGEQSIEPITFHNIFNSELPALENIKFTSVFEVDMRNWSDRSTGTYQVKPDANIYKFPKKFLEPNRLSKLKSISICGEFEKNQKELFLSSAIGSRANVDYLLDGFVEVYK